MSCESGKGSSPQSESSSGSTNQPLVMFQRDDVTLHGTPAPLRLNRTQTVRRASKSTPPAPDDSGEVSKPIQTPHADTPVPEKHRRSLDSTYRHSLESISEYKTKSSFSSMSLFTTSRDASSLDSASSDCTDCMRSFTDLTKEKTFLSASSSYLSWMESVNSEYCASAKSATDVVDVDTKVGEWNNFWLNYSSGSNKYATSPYLSISNDDKTGEELSDCRSTTSTQREFTDKQISNEQIFLSYDEVVEAVKCSQRITEILQNALKRNENDVDESRNDSYFSQHSFPLALPALFTSLRKEESTPGKERPRSYSLFEPKEMQKQKLLRTPSGQSNSGNCINTLLNSGVADILKRVISKRKDVVAPDEQTTKSSGSRNSFTEWSSAK